MRWIKKNWLYIGLAAVAAYMWKKDEIKAAGGVVNYVKSLFGKSDK